MVGAHARVGRGRWRAMALVLAAATTVAAFGVTGSGPAAHADPLVTAPTTDAGDIVALRVSTRIGTNPNGSRCTSAHTSATSVRVYYDSFNRPAHLGLTITPSPAVDVYLHSHRAPCVDSGAASAAGAA